jgi:CheY-like chemotaxis protein
MGEGELILVVDDEPAIREVCTLILQSYGYGVITATNGADALSLYAERKASIRLVLTDMMMPGLDGVETIRGLREIDPDVRIIASSGLAAGGHSQTAAELGVDGFLLKPYTTEILLEKLREVLGAPPAP